MDMISNEYIAVRDCLPLKLKATNATGVNETETKIEIQMVAQKM